MKIPTVLLPVCFAVAAASAAAADLEPIRVMTTNAYPLRAVVEWRASVGHPIPREPRQRDAIVVLEQGDGGVVCTWFSPPAPSAKQLDEWPTVGDLAVEPAGRVTAVQQVRRVLRPLPDRVSLINTNATATAGQRARNEAIEQGALLDLTRAVRELAAVVEAQAGGSTNEPVEVSP